LLRRAILTSMEETIKSQQPTVANGDDGKAKRERSTLTKVLPTDRIQFDRQVEILKAYAAIYEANGGNPVTNDEAGDTLTPKFSGSTLTQAVPFFTDIGLIERVEGGKFVPGRELLAYNKARQWSEAEAREKLRPLFEKTWFYKCLIPRLQLAPQPVENCLAVFSEESKAQKDYEPRLKALIDFLVLAGVVSVADGVISYAHFRPLIGQSLVGLPAPDQQKGHQDQTVHSYVLPLPNKRKVTVEAPLDITKAEISRLQKWIEFTLLLDWKEDDMK
jgi:hypothetical protein